MTAVLRRWAGFLIAILVAVLWGTIHPVRPLLPTSDLYGHLSVARHLLRGDGFVCDIAYPLSFAHDFARRLPQPLIHRGPGFSLLLTAPVALAGGDAAAAVRHTRDLQIGLLGLLAWLGAAPLLRRRRLGALGAWLALLLMSPLLDYAVDWGLVELPVAVCLLWLWIRHRDSRSAGPGVGDGLLAGALTLLRWDLCWLPLVWWLWGGRADGDEAPPVAARGRHISRRGLWVAVAVMLVLNLPWLARNLRLTGNPLFSVQGEAELVKDTTAWPGYTVYRQLDPQPVGKVLAENPVPVLRKVARGLRFYGRRLGGLVPWPGLVVMALALVGFLRTATGERWRTDRGRPPRPGPLVTATLTLIALAAQYACFDHSLRHLLVVYPVLAWELAGVGDRGGRFLVDRSGLNPRLAPIVVLIATAVLVRISRPALPGWAQAAVQAEAATAQLAADTRRLADDPAAVPFVAAAAPVWYADRPAVWDPQNEAVRRRIRELLSRR